ncbi:TonB family protein [Nitrospira sp. M1]
MTSASAVQPECSPRIFSLCGILSLAFHASVLLGLSLIQPSPPAIDTSPTVKVTLVPTEVPMKTEAPSAAPEATAPPLKTLPRRVPTPPVTQPVQPQISQPQPMKAVAALQLDAVPPNTPPLTPPKKRILKDTLASDALFAQSATKMVKRSRTSLATSSTSTSPHMTIAQHPTVGPLRPSIHAIKATPPPSLPTKTRRLTASLPTTKGLGIKKIGVRHSVRPVYPRVAKEEGWEGIVLLRVLVHTSGMPGKITIRKSSGHKILDEAAIAAMRQWRFAPAKDGNFVIEKHVDVPLKFGLHG